MHFSHAKDLCGYCLHTVWVPPGWFEILAFLTTFTSVLSGLSSRLVLFLLALISQSCEESWEMILFIGIPFPFVHLPGSFLAIYLNMTGLALRYGCINVSTCRLSTWNGATHWQCICVCVSEWKSLKNGGSPHIYLRPNSWMIRALTQEMQT